MPTTAKPRTPKSLEEGTHPQKQTATSRQGKVSEQDLQFPVPEELLDMDPGYEDERMALLKQYAPECLNKRDRKTGRELPQSGEFVEHFADPERSPQRLVAHGYEAVMDAEGNQVNHRGDLLFRVPREKWQKAKARIGRRSHEVANAHLKAEDETSKAHGFHLDR